MYYSLFISVLFLISHASSEPCRFSFPAGCQDNDCQYQASWQLNTTSQQVNFLISSRLTEQRWSGIGFSTDTRMPNSDLVLSSTDSRIADWWMSAYSSPELDATNNLQNAKAFYADGRLYTSFTRPLRTGDAKDTDLNSCPYFFFPVEGGSYVNGRAQIHTTTPRVVGPICSLNCALPKYAIQTGKCTGSIVLTGAVRSSLQECGTQCDLVPECRGFQYDATSSLCSLNRQNCASPTIVQNSYIYAKLDGTQDKPTDAKAQSFKGFTTHNFRCPGNLLSMCDPSECPTEVDCYNQCNVNSECIRSRSETDSVT